MIHLLLSNKYQPKGIFSCNFLAAARFFLMRQKRRKRPVRKRTIAPPTIAHFIGDERESHKLKNVFTTSSSQPLSSTSKQQKNEFRY